jgi:hypothetical protein
MPSKRWSGTRFGEHEHVAQERECVTEAMIVHDESDQIGKRSPNACRNDRLLMRRFLITLPTGCEAAQSKKKTPSAGAGFDASESFRRFKNPQSLVDLIRGSWRQRLPAQARRQKWVARAGIDGRQ